MDAVVCLVFCLSDWRVAGAHTVGRELPSTAKVFLPSLKPSNIVIYTFSPEWARTDRMAEWSKALDLGSSPPGRGFKSHFCHNWEPS